ncbi:multimerin-2 [Cynocephalus volans]|uniref:multimerin-2 n=1 Tax=Cynocephalus volans TaxID=110931 RepID=UPI002FCA80F9
MILTLLLGLGGLLGWGLLGAWAQFPSTRFPDPHASRLPEVERTEAEDTGRDPVRRNWCPYQKSRLVTFVATCKMEKFLVHSQQPCPQGALECQKVKVMYRMAQKPVYQVKQKVLTSVAWRCCPGFGGSDCQHHAPTAIPEPADPSDGRREPWDWPVNLKPGHLPAEINEVEARQGQQERLLGDLQNDVHQMADSLPGLLLNFTAVTEMAMEANHTERELLGKSSEQTLSPHMGAFQEVHFSPIWRSINESLHSLFQAIRNLSLDVEVNRQAIKQVQESTVARADFQELGAKFEAKVQENAQRVGQLQRDVDDRLHAQQLALHHSLSEVQAHVDTKLKQLHKAQEALGTNGSLVVAGAAARPEPESLQARLGQLQRNLSALHVASGRREEELQSTLKDMRATLARHVDEIQELYSESDETFDQISKVERQVEELQVNHTALRELRVILMEKSLITEENEQEVKRQLLELNLTLQHLQGGHADLIKYVKDCSCLREGHRDGSSVRAPSGAVDAQEAQGERAAAARLRSQMQALAGEVRALQAAAGETRRDVRQLHSSFAALLEDALRHEAVLAALFGEEAMDDMSDEAPGQLPLSYEQIRVALQEAASGLQEQALGWDALATRVAALEQAAGGGLELPQPATTEPSRHGRCCEASWAASLNGSLQSLHQELSATEQGLGQHRQLFHSLFGNFQGLVAANVSLDLGKLHAVLSRKGKKQQKGLEAPRKRDKRQVEPLADAAVKGPVPGALGAALWEAGSPVAFYAGFAEGTAAPQMVKFNTTYINIGNSYVPEHGYFRAPEHGIYLFAVSTEFGPGPGTGQLVFGGHRRTPVCTTEQSGGSMATTFAMAELQKGERVWFELTQGSVTKRSPPGTAFGGFLMFKT